jgi:hypothetical protein
MQIDFLADNRFSRKPARLIWRQFFAFYLRGVRQRWLVLVVLLFTLWPSISFLLAPADVEWLAGWGLPDSVWAWPYAPLACLAGLFSGAVLAQGRIAQLKKSHERKFADRVPQEQACLDRTETEVTMKSTSATISVPRDKVTGLALSKEARAIGFSGAGMIMPRSACASPTKETALLRAMAKGLKPEALQRSSKAVMSLS